MTLAFPNPTRSFDPSANCVRFCGHDSAIEVSFFVEVGAIAKIDPNLIQKEAEILTAFDLHIEKIKKAATKAYDKGKGTYVCTLTAECF